MNWPTGKYNGQRIVGFEIKLKFRIHDWRFSRGSSRYGTATCLGPFMLWLSAEYEHDYERHARLKKPTK